MRKLFLTIIGVLCILNATYPQVIVDHIKTSVTISNEMTGLIFDLEKGTYSVVNRLKNKEILSDAFFTVESLSGTESFLRYSCDEESVNDTIGSGKKLVITGTKTGLPQVIFEVTLYTGKTFIVLNCGLNNNTTYPVRIKSFHPLTGQRMYDEEINDEFYLLDGNAGGENTFVTSGNELGCRNNLLCTSGRRGNRSSFVIGGLTYHEFEKFASVKKTIGSRNKDGNSVNLGIDLCARDPVGKLVDPGDRYIPDDKFYIDFCTSNPLESLEQYGQILRIAQNVKLNVYDFPTLCLWYGGMDQYGGGPKNNDSPGAVWEMEQAAKRGILKYSRFAVRLVPDNIDQQGWWDDEHFQKIGNTANYIGPCYKYPYETTKKWSEAVINMGGLPFMYSRSGFRAGDFSKRYPEYMLYNDPSSGLDFTDPGFISHIQKVYACWKEGGIKGMMFDYPASGWAPEGGFEDKYSTAAGAYRNMFRLAAEGLGPGSYIQENKLSRGSDITLGVVASQRTAGDADEINPLMVTRDGLRWYKNRIVVNYDKDAKNPLHARPLNRDGWRTMYTMSYVTGGRFLLGLSLSKINDEQFYDLTRTIPYHRQHLSARPVDAFTGKKDPQVYDFIVNKNWHQVVFYNTTLDDENYTGTENFKYPVGNYIGADISIACSGEPGFGALGLDPQSRFYVYDFWNDIFLGEISGSDTLNQSLRPGETRMLSLHEVENNPQFISTGRHIMQGYTDIIDVGWDKRKSELRGTSEVVAGETYKIIIACNGRKISHFSAKNAGALYEIADQKNGIAVLSLNTSSGGRIEWAVSFK